jgi:hypothetical protein
MKTAPEPASRSEGRIPSPDWLLKMELATAPKIATPTAEPMVRANWSVQVTTSRSFQATKDWAAITDGIVERPMPKCHRYSPREAHSGAHRFVECRHPIASS